MTVVTRFAPSPTGDLHLGHAYAAVFAHDWAEANGGRFLVRIEDIDRSRCRTEFIERNLDDLRWLGLRWDEPVVRQSERMNLYRDALDRLTAQGVTYACLCTRSRIRAEIEAAGGAPQGAEGDTPSYPGTCRNLDPQLVRNRIAGGEAYAVRLDSRRALALAGPLDWRDMARGRQSVEPADVSDVVIARKEMATSYHLAVTVDDALQGVTHVTRGEDLFTATHIHRLLAALLGLTPPVWHHHALCRDAAGRRLAKRERALSLRALRDQGLSAGEIRAMARAGAAASAADR